MRVTKYILTSLCFLNFYIHNPSVLQSQEIAVEDIQEEEQVERITEDGEKKENPKKTTVHTQEVVVSATKVDKDLLDVPVSVSIIGAEEVERSGARTIGDALRDVAGVELTSDGTQGLKRISIRGEKTSGTVILIDGQRIVENRSIEGTPILIDPSRIERIEVIKGPSSVLYGSDAMGGVINIITKKGGRKAIEGEIFGGYNGNTNGFTEGLSLYGAKEGFTYRASIAQNDQGNLRTPKGRVSNTGFSNTDASLYLDYTFLKKYTVGLAYDYYHANIRSTIEPVGLNGNVYKLFEANMPSWERQKVSTFFMAKDITDYLSRIRIDLFYQENTKKFDNALNMVGMPMQTNAESENINQQIGFSAQTDWLLGSNTLLITGYEFEYDTLNTTGSSKTAPPSTIQNATPKRYNVKGHVITNALYAQGETELPKDFILNYGSRLSVISSGINSHRGTIGSAVLQTLRSIVETTQGKTYVHPVFNLGFMYTGVQDTTFRLGFSQGFRAPNLQERFINTSAAEVIYANPKLKPEASHTIEFGTRYFANNWRVDVNTFYTFTENYIIAQPLSVQRPVGRASYRYSNVGKAQSVGIEGDIRYTIEPISLTPYTTMAFIKRQLDYGNFTTWNSGSPDLSGRVGLLYENDFTDQGFSFYADLFGHYATSATYTQPNGKGTLTMHVDSFITANLHTGVRFGKERQYYFDLMVNNIFNHTYITPLAVRQVGGGYLYEPGFHVAMQIGARF